MHTTRLTSVLRLYVVIENMVSATNMNECSFQVPHSLITLEFKRCIVYYPTILNCEAIIQRVDKIITMPLRKRIFDCIKPLSISELETKWPYSLSPTSQSLTYHTNPKITKQKTHQPTKSRSAPSLTSFSLICPSTQPGNARKP